MNTIRTDICVIGAGSGGLSVAAGAAQMGARVVLIEKGEMGGDCLNYGCVPSKALLAAAAHAQAMRTGAAFGIAPVEPQVDFARVEAHVKDVIAGIAPHDSQERFEGLGVKVIRAQARFVDARTVEAGGVRVRARRFVIATGSRPVVPPIPGLDTVPFLTNETVFDNATRPDHLAIIGGGPIGMELGQAHLRLGARVSVLEGAAALGRDDPDLAAIVKQRLVEEGLDLREQAKVTRVERTGAGIRVHFEEAGGPASLDASHLLVAVGRKPNVEGLGLEAAGIKASARGIATDSRLRTTNRRVFAIGDVRGGLQFTHVAGYDAGIVIRNALFRLPARADYSAVPHVTYTDPELAHVGLRAEEARARHGAKVQVLDWSFADNDRARTERRTEGRIRVVTGPRGVVLGATIAGLHAGELLAPWIMAVGARRRIGEMAQFIAPYPTLTEISKRVAGSYYTPALYGARMRFIVRLLMRLPG